LENDICSLYSQLMEEIKIVQKLEEERQIFLRGVTHELKTPIMIMGVTIESILAGIDGYQDSQVAMQDCYQTLQAMSNLVNEILDIAKIESVKDISTNTVNNIVEETLISYQPLLQDKQIQVDLQMQDKMELTIPYNHLQKVVSNIISNALKYTPNNGEFKILINKTSAHFINTMYEDAKVDMDKVFKAFVTYDTKQTDLHKSHGLGLYIITAILEQYNIEYHSWIDEEQQFHIEIGQKSR
ncbi:MAG: sensor histidine kinase, partial [Coprobacillaceae bacterium]